jgi:[protein-PII] uridylyltransferase
MREIENPQILFLTALLHDIGKGMRGDHSPLGAEMTQHIATRMGLSSEEKESIGFLVRHHLLMVETALRRDLHDEQVILRFANQVTHLNQLKMLYLLTFADIKAVGPEAWTSWKDTLLKELFLKTSHFFERAAVNGPFFKGEEAIKKLEKFLSPEIFSEYVPQLPDRYLSCYALEEIAHHIDMACLIEKELLLVDWEIEKKTQAKVTVCTKDRYGLFSKITGSMFLNRLNILEAQIHTWENGIALDTFWVEDVTEEIERRLSQLKKDLKEILSGEVPLKDLLAKRNKSNGIKQKVIPKVSGEIKINNQDSDFYTIVEVTGEDRMGILYEMTQALTDHGCDIHFARISTLGNRIVDVFYVQDEWGEKIVEKNRTEQLKRTLLSRLTTRENT